MLSERSYRALADLVLLVHFSFVAFVLLGFLLIWIGYFARWEVVRNLRFRMVHLLAIGFVAAEATIGLVCPLTTLEAFLRSRVGERSYEGSFVQHWLGRVIFLNLPEWVFTIVYLLFFALVFATWWVVKPVRRRLK